MKHDLYKEMIDRMHAANAAGNYYEALWYAFALLEDRTTSMLNALGVVSKAEAGLYDKTIALAWRASERDGALGVYLRDDELVTSTPQDRAKAVGRATKKKRNLVEKQEDEDQVKKFPALNALSDFRLKRNDLAHDLASGESNMAMLDAQAKELSSEGIRLVGTFAKIARRVKEHAEHL